jgi:NAD-dependent dihydropyrimidine dehydrogenase PreA subunit
MNVKATRKIVKIDEDKCDGCGLCVPDCAEGAIQVIDGKAKLLAENLCDGLGNCLGVCPRDAIIIEERPADEFDEAAVEAVKAAAQKPAPTPCGCPGTMARSLEPQAAPSEKQAPRGSQLSHWPVQLTLVPPSGAMWDNADVLISADCVAFAMPDFHERLLAGRAVVIACPKLDDVGPYIDKLTRIFADNSIKSVTVAHMEVPCCTGIVMAARAAMDASGRTDIPFSDITVGIDGTVRSEN